MNQESCGPRYLLRWDHSRDQRLDRELLMTTHRLPELPLFTDEGLANLLDRSPRDQIEVTTMGEDPAYPNQLRYGRLGPHGGRDLIEMIRRGRLCVRIRDLVQQDEFGPLIQRLASEVVECQPGLRTSDHDGWLELCSPTTHSYLRCEITPTITWQIRGQRQFLVYPNRPPVVDEHSLEAVLTGTRANHPTYYEPDFEDQVEVYLQSAGEMIALPQYTPLRTVNGSFCVTLTTSYQTLDSRRRNDVRVANYHLNRIYTKPNRSVEISGWGFLAKAALLRTPLAKKTFRPSDRTEITFQVDPSALHCIGSVQNDSTESDSVIPPLANLGLTTTSPANVGTEN